MKKSIAIICSLVLMLGVLSACKNTTVDNTTENKNTSSESTSKASSVSGESTDKNASETSAKKDEEKTTDKKSASQESTTKAEVKKAFPSFDAEDIFGAKVSSKVFSKRKLTVVNVFATWCTNNENDLSIFSELENELKSIGFIGIVLDINEGDGIDESALRSAKKLCTNAGADYPYLITNDSLTEFCRNIYSLPVTYFVDSEGNIVGDPIVGSNSVENWKAVIEQKLAML